MARLSGDELGVVAQDAQEFQSGGIGAAFAGFPFGEAGFGDAEGGGKFALVHTEAAPQVGHEPYGVEVTGFLRDDDDGTAGGGVGDGVCQGLLCDFVQQGGDFCCCVSVATGFRCYFGQAAGVVLCGGVPADDAGELLGCVHAVCEKEKPAGFNTLHRRADRKGVFFTHFL